jgi:hypothetical protein
MKKNEAAYGLLDGHIVPCCKWSLRKAESSVCSAWDSLMSLLLSVAGAPGFSSISWSQGRNGGISAPFCGVKTSAKSLYWLGIFGGVLVRSALLAMSWQGTNLAFAASDALKTMGS